MDIEYLNEISCLREWSPILDMWNQINESTEVLCMDATENLIALGTNESSFIIYDRITNGCRTFQFEENSSSCTFIKVISSVDFMIACGTSSGQVNIFQIPKTEMSSSLVFINKRKNVKRFVVRNLHKSEITAGAWSRNAMKLFTGDSSGIVIYTSIDYNTESIQSQELVNESFQIVQINVHKNLVLISTIYRTVICTRSEANEFWNIVQVGSKERKTLGKYGSYFINNGKYILSARHGFKFLLSDLNGKIEKTLNFKETFLVKQMPLYKIPLLNPSRFMNSETFADFNIPKIYLEYYVVVWDHKSLYILSLDKLQIEAMANGFRNIIGVCISDKEILVLESCRSLIRLAPNPELYPSSVIVFQNLVFEELGIDENVMEAQEAEHVKYVELSPDNIENKLEEFARIGNLDFENSILYPLKSKKK